MLKASRRLEYALMVLKKLSESQDYLSARELSDLLGAPFDTVAKVLQVMNSENIVQVQHGVKGGYRLARPLEELNYLDFLELIDGPAPLVKCLSVEGQCELLNTCNLQSPFTLLDAKLRPFLREVGLHELLHPKDAQL